MARDVETNYILQCQSLGLKAPKGAINNMYPGTEFSWIIPSEVAVSGWALLNLGEQDAAKAAGSFLENVQNADGSWADQYNNHGAVRGGRSTRNVVQPVMFLAALHTRGLGNYTKALLRASTLLTSRLHPSGLLHDGSDQNFWLSDNAYAVVVWHRLGEHGRRNATVEAINKHFLNLASNSWHHVLGPKLSPRAGPFGWVHFAPAMLDLRAFGVVYPSQLALHMQRSLQISTGPDAGAVLENENSSKRMPGIGFQASLAWRDLGENGTKAAAAHSKWCVSKSRLWQTSPDSNGITGGWIDWKNESGGTAPVAERFIDTSAYHLMYTHVLRFHNGIEEPWVSQKSAPANLFKLPIHYHNFRMPPTKVRNRFWRHLRSPKKHN